MQTMLRNNNGKYCRVVHSPKISHKAKVTVTIPTVLLMEFDNIVLKFTRKSKEPRADVTVWKNSGVRIFMLAALQAFLKLEE